MPQGYTGTLGLLSAPPLQRKNSDETAVPDSDPCLYSRRLLESLVANKSSRIQGPCSFPSYALLTFRYQRPSIVLPSPLVKDRFSPPMPQGSTGTLGLLSAPSLQR